MNRSAPPARLRAHDPSAGIHDADALLEVLRRAIDVPRDPPPPTLDALVAHIESMGILPAAFEAYWDGDTNGWIAVLAVLTRESPSARLRTAHEIALRWHESRPAEWHARRLGDGLAARFGAPFHFPSEARPDDRARRWSDTE